MGLIGIILLVFFVISALLLILIVLLQDEQGEGLGGIFGGGSSSPFGSRSGNVITRFTTILASLFILTSLGLAIVNKSGDSGNVLGAARKEAAKEAAGNWWEGDAGNQQTENTAEDAAGNQ